MLNIAFESIRENERVSSILRNYEERTKTSIPLNVKLHCIFGCKYTTSEENKEYEKLKGIFEQQTNIKKEDIDIICKMISKVVCNKIPGDPIIVATFLKKSEFSDKEISLYNPGITAFSHTQYYNDIITKHDQSIVDGVQEIGPDIEKFANNPAIPLQNTGAYDYKGQWGFQPAPGMVSHSPEHGFNSPTTPNPVQPTVSPITPVAPSTPVK